MKHLPTNLLFTTLLLLLQLTSPTLTARTTNPSKVPRDAVLLSKISSLTLRANQLTTSRRVAAVPQAKCTGASRVCSLYTVDTMRCTNEGADYDDENIQWTCTASLPEEFKLGSTDVTCEGYESSDDPYVLKGSCGVEYRLLLTEKGEKRFGRGGNGNGNGGGGGGGSGGEKKSSWGWVFWLIFVGVLAVIVLAACGCIGRSRSQTPDGRPGRGWGFGGGGGGPGGPGGPGGNDAPPPYDYQTIPKQPSSRSSYWPSSFPGYQRNNNNYNNGSGAGSWRPGFWSGAAGGAAAGYAAGAWNNNRQNQNEHYQHGGGSSSGGFWGGDSRGNSRNNSRNNSPNGGSNNGQQGDFSSSDRYESTGFGSTSRR